MSRAITPAAMHQPKELVHGFRITAVTELDDIKVRAYEATHEKTGAQVLHLHCNDEENLFSVGFRTPPPDSTGVAHILEHSVLAGSQKYPVKDAFNELGKRTLNTFLNAMTWPDRTVYPVASAVRADYFNLARVYADLVFHPLLRKETLLQEGHHLEFTEPDNKESDLTVSGIVYNEMKGVYASPESVAYRAIQQSILPDTPYGLDSGGDPEKIPDLTYDQFVNFHSRYYSPSNARFFLYGDVPLQENLAFLAGVLAPFDKVEVDSSLPLQPRWGESRKVEESYPIGEDEPLEKKSFVSLCWLVGETADVLDNLLMEIAVSSIYGTSAGPLRKALVDSKLGQDLFPSSGFDNDIRESIAHVGLRGTEPEKADQIESLIFDTLKKIVEEGIDPSLIEATFHQIELYGKEINPPFPIMLMMRANPPWFFDGDPKAGLSFSHLVEQARKAHADDPGIFEKLLQKRLIDNPHRIRLVLSPSNTLAKETQAAFQEKMAAKKASLSEGQLEAIRKEAQALKEAQEAPPDPEALATLPQLDIADIPRKVRTIPMTSRDAQGTQVIEHPLFTNGLVYVGLSFDMRDIAEEHVPYLPLLGRATVGLGAAGLTYDQMAVRIAQHTGGFGASPTVGRDLHSREIFQTLLFDGKFLPRNSGEFFAILTDLLTSSNTQEHERLKDLIRAAASQSQSRLIPSGHMFAYLRAAAALDHTYWRREQWDGTTQMLFLQGLAQQLDKDTEAIGGILSQLQSQIFARKRLTLHVAADPEVLEQLRPELDAFLQGLPEGTAAQDITPTAPTLPHHVGVEIPAEVNYVAQVLQMPDMLDARAPAFEMLAEVLSNELLYQKIRVQGGAYGGFSFYAGDSGLLPMLSYRDPNLIETMEVFANVASFAKSDVIDDEIIDGSRLGAIGSLDRVLAPKQQLDTARRRMLLGLTDEDRQRFRTGLLEVKAEQVREVAGLLEEALKTSTTAALGSKSRLEEANARLPQPLTLVSLTPKQDA
ncbi:MAG: insulinase family protein [Myxococcales bacterium]|nr:insulinase family protein [Myxococcales bacterium]